MVSLIVVKGFSGADKSNRADGNKIVHVLLPSADVLRVVLVDDIRHQAQIMLYESIPRLGVAGGYLLYTLLLLGFAQLLRKRTPGIQVQPDEQKIL